jgi:hypothetical protein
VSKKGVFLQVSVTCGARRWLCFQFKVLFSLSKWADKIHFVQIYFFSFLASNAAVLIVGTSSIDGHFFLVTILSGALLLLRAYPLRRMRQY